MLQGRVRPWRLPGGGRCLSAWKCWTVFETLSIGGAVGRRLSISSMHPPRVVFGKQGSVCFHACVRVVLPFRHMVRGSGTANI